MEWEKVWNVLKWVLAALAAGFIGQFGRSFALHLIERRRRRNPSAETNGSTDRSIGYPADTTEHAKMRAKIEKKREKAELKRRKKDPPREG